MASELHHLMNEESQIEAWQMSSRALLEGIIMKVTKGILAALLTMTALVGTARCGAFDDAEDWGGYWRRSESAYGRRYQVPPTLYYGHSPLPAPRPVSPTAHESPLYRRIPPTPDGVTVPPFNPPYYGRGRYYGPAIDPYYAPGRDYYGNTRYGWW
jgi:hypothetical protein